MQYPVSLDLLAQLCVVIGGGRVAARKVEGLLSCGARVRVIAPRLSSDLDGLVLAGAIEAERRGYREGDLDGALIAFAATDDAAVNSAVFSEGEARGVPVNAADDPSHCRFTLPSVVRRGDLTIAISTGGRSPALAAHLRRRLAAEVGPEWAAVTELLGEAREKIHEAGRSTEGMDERWGAAISDDVLELIRIGDIEGARERIEQCLS